jgi:hypothetical protein
VRLGVLVRFGWQVLGGPVPDFMAALRRRPVGKVAAHGLAGRQMLGSEASLAGWVVACVRHRHVSDALIFPGNS